MTASEPARAPAVPGPPANYFDFYGLAKPPFGGAPDSAGYILFSSHRRTFELLIDHMVNGSGMVILLAEDGSGKTETLRSAASVMAEAGLQTIMVSRPPDGRVSLDQLILALKGQPAGNEKVIEDPIGNFWQPPRKALLADDIELMPDNCISLLLSLTRAKPNEAGGQAIVLSSSIDLKGGATRPELARLASLAQTTLRLSRLGPAEVRQYIERSLWIAGGETRRLITNDAMKLIVARSGGLPGTVNRLMEAAFTAGFARGDTTITAKTMAAAIGPTAPRPTYHATETIRGAGRALPIVAAGLLITGASVFLYKGLKGPSEHASPALPKPTVVQTPSAPPPPAVVKVPEQSPVEKPNETLPPELIAALTKRGNQSLVLGDTSAARLLFQRAAAAGNAAAATALGKTYDPNFTTVASARDPGRAADWYRQAIALGDPKAADLLKRLGVR